MIVVNGKPISLNGKFFEYKNDEPTPPYPTDYQYLKFNYSNDTIKGTIINAINNKGFSAEENDGIITCKIPNSTYYVSFGNSINNNGTYGCVDWYLPYVTNTTALFEWTPLTSIPDNFWGLSATKNIGRGFNCLWVRGGNLSEVKSFDGLVNLENFEYAFYENHIPITFPTAFAPDTFSKTTGFYGCFDSVTATNNMVPFATQCTAATNKNTRIASCPDLTEFRALGWS